MNRDDLFIRMDRENNREFIAWRLDAKAQKLSYKDRMIHNLNMCLLPLGFDKNKDVIAVYGDRLGYFVQELAKYYNVISIGRLKNVSIKNGWKQGIHFMMYRKWNRMIVEGYLAEDWQKVDRQVKEIEHVFKKNKVKFLIVTDLSPMYQRALCLAARNLHIPIACYEHTSILTMVQDAEEGRFFQEHAKDYTDFFWLWSEKNRRQLIDLKITTEEKSYVIGYPYKVERLPIEKRKSVLWIGDGEIHHSETPEIYYGLAEQIFQYCQENRIAFTYRPHPKERKEFIYPLVEKGMKLSTGSLPEDLESHLIVIGAKTSCMLEAGLYEDVVLQLFWDEKLMEGYLFENAYVLPPDSIQIKEKIADAVKGELKPKEMNGFNLQVCDIGKKAKTVIEKNMQQYGEQ